MLRVVLTGLGVLVIFTGVVLSLVAWTIAPRDQRVAAEARWQRMAPADYRISVRVHSSSFSCEQQLQVRDAEVITFSDTCRRVWLGKLTVQRLFELSERLEQPPECFPWPQNCFCQRARIGTISYDPQSGLPTRLAWQRDLHPNWFHVDYWRYVMRHHGLPSCGPLTQNAEIEVVGFDPQIRQ